MKNYRACKDLMNISYITLQVHSHANIEVHTFFKNFVNISFGASPVVHFFTICIDLSCSLCACIKDSVDIDQLALALEDQLALALEAK